MPGVVLGERRGPAAGGRCCPGHLALAVLLPASIHKPLCELSSAGFRQPCNVLRGTSWRAAMALTRGHITSPAPGLEKARTVSQEGAAALEQNHRNRQSPKSWRNNN